MTFREQKNQLISRLEEIGFSHDPALHRIVTILNEVNSEADLRKEKKRLSYMAVDGVLNTEAIELILQFLN